MMISCPSQVGPLSPAPVANAALYSMSNSDVNAQVRRDRHAAHTNYSSKMRAKAIKKLRSECDMWKSLFNTQFLMFHSEPNHLKCLYSTSHRYV